MVFFGWSSVPRHFFTDELDVGLVGRRFVNEFSAGHDDDAVGEREQLVEVFADEQDGDAVVAGLDELRVDEIDRRKIEAEAGIGGDEYLRGAGTQLAREHGTLDVAAGKVADGRVGTGCLD